MNNTHSIGNDEIVFDISAREGAPGFVGMFFTIYMKAATMLTNPEVHNRSLQLQYITNFMISMIPGKTQREKIRTQLQENITTKVSEYKKTAGDHVDLEDIARINDDCNLQIIGEITDFIDQHVGISMENKLGSV